MSWKAHLALSLALLTVSFGAGAVAGRRLLGEHPLLWLLGGAVAALACRFAVRALLPARCASCGAHEAWQTGSRPIVYACRGCGARVVTPISEGGRLPR